MFEPTVNCTLKEYDELRKFKERISAKFIYRIPSGRKNDITYISQTELEQELFEKNTYLDEKCEALREYNRELNENIRTLKAEIEMLKQKPRKSFFEKWR
jgi:predicted RNase H-like nuclease (RuvC/YqgF family)